MSWFEKFFNQASSPETACSRLSLPANSAKMTGPNRRSFLQLLGLCLSYGLLLVILLGLTLWAAGALYFTFPFREVRGLSAAIYAIAVLGVLVAVRPLWKGAIAGVGFYNELTSNCTTNVRVHTAATAVGKHPPWDWRILTNGYADQMLYERGDLVGQLAFADLKKQALINEKAKAADYDPDFSRRIGDGAAGF